jgi:hypothetical protein
MSSYRLGKNICTTHTWQRTCVQNIQKTLTTNNSKKQVTIRITNSPKKIQEWKISTLRPGTVAHICNPSYLKGGDQEDRNLGPAWAKSKPHLNK